MTANKKREQQLQAELDTSSRMCHDKNRQISRLEEELQVKQKGMAFLTAQFEQQQGELNMLKQQGEARVYGADSKCIAVMY